jgi:hypothetical protein
MTQPTPPNRPTQSTATPGGFSTMRKTAVDALMAVRSHDVEPYIGLRYVSRLFRLIAVVLVLLLVAEVTTGLISQGQAAIPRLLAEVSRLVVLAGLLWGSGDLAILLIDIGHDVRATRILLGRQAATELSEQHQARREMDRDGR